VAAQRARLPAALYALLAGFGVPAQRTLLMLAATVALRATGLRWPWPLVLIAAAAVVTMFDPWALLQAGFWLSFAAVGLLMASDPLQHEAAAPGALAQLRAMLRTQAIATLGLAPLSLAFFQQVSLVGFIANLLAIPWIKLVVTPLSLAGVVLPWLWQWAALAMSGLVVLLQWLTSWPAAVWSVPAAPAWAVAAGLAAALLGLLPLPWRLARWPCHWRCRCCGRRWHARCRAASSSWCSTSGRAPRCCCARSRSCWSTTPGRPTHATPMPANASSRRCCARAASIGWTC
jgi:competence protein ComEC